jgi:acyl-CoA synthetase (AMP-forming)/AMP-acid ligase II
MSLRDLTLVDMIDKHARLRGDQTAFVGEDRQWSFREFADDADDLAGGLLSLGVTRGQRIAVFAYNCYEFFLLYAAAARLGAIVVPVNWRLKPEEVQQILEDCTPKVLVASPEFADSLGPVLDSCLFTEHRLVTGEAIPGYRPLSDVLSSSHEAEPLRIEQDDPFIIIHTAAVDARPRGAVLTHRNLVAAGLQVMLPMNIRSDAVYVNLMPVFHVMGLEMAVAVLMAGGRNVIMKRFDAGEAARHIEQQQASIIATVPPMLSSILDEADRSGSHLTSLRTVAGLFDDAETIRRCQRITGAHFWSGYGQTETSGYISLAPYDERLGSSGCEGPMVSLQLIDEYDRPVRPGEPGEIAVRGPLIFREYWNLKEETAYTLRDGWHHTGDVGKLDDNGYLWYLHRKAEKELIKPGGENVYPAEVEKALVQHEDVVEACVFGVPDKEWGEAVKAVCVLRPTGTLNQKDLIEFVSSRIAGYKKPKHIEFVESLPKKEDGSVDREKVKTGS